MPDRPDDDWTRPMPRSPRRRRDDWSRDPDATQRVERPGRQDEWGQDQGYDDQRYSDRGYGSQGEDDRYADHGYDDRYADHGYDDRYDDQRYDDRYDAQGYDDRHDDRYDDQRHADRRHDQYSSGGAYDDRRYDDRTRRRARRRVAPPPPRPRRRRPRYGFRRFLALLVLLIVAYVVTMIVVVSLVWGSVNRIDATPQSDDRPGGVAGGTYLLVGTDSRENLSQEQRDDFGTGFAEGHRADTVMLLHVPTIGDPTLVSLPRDSYVEVPGHGFDKLNAAHSIGGAELLVDTVEQATDMRIDGYLEIGFGGFVSVVDGVGGVEMCLDAPVQDDKAHVDLPAGCQTLGGSDALGYVRMRYSDPRGDIGRVERQREFLAALVDKIATPATVLNPWRLHQVGTATGSAVAIGENTSMLDTARMALAMRSIAGGTGTSVTVPVANPGYQTPSGSAVLWNEEGAAQLFSALRHGQAITVDP